MRLRTRLAEQFGFQLSSSRGTTTGFPGRTLGLFSIFTCITVEFSSYCQGWAKYVFFIHLCAFTIFQAPVNCPTKRIMCFDPSALTPFDVWILLSRPLIINFAQFSSLLLPSLNNTSSSPLSLCLRRPSHQSDRHATTAICYCCWIAPKIFLSDNANGFERSFAGRKRKK